MNLAAISVLAFAMSTDAFAAAVGKGTALLKPRWSEALRTGAIFGVIEAITPIVGWALGSAASDYVKAWDHWIAFVLLLGLGGHMLLASLKTAEDEVEKPKSHGFWLLAVTGFATSIDAMAVGVGLAFLDVNILTVALAIGLATFTMVTLGVMVGRFVGAVAGRWAEGLGGILLMGIGALILFEHLKAG
ncbi:manganese efflux pump MntP [Comamonas endophytica]|uniref:Putative manganese efflux pump MntP n=1 Tax=Comamonas endophytica TaxID=2949090 RepID=A0ABY6GEM3_9BURK|nr:MULTISPECIES: manganese efflux pump MntP [unclassified Acidovorax]MCD2513216.1 manganese efflux pump MntP [Acidovorax sp. D4N7]UYG53439.1 manganese efflux pump MntP [Acidovorax sp. 5MLIR]